MVDYEDVFCWQVMENLSNLILPGIQTFLIDFFNERFTVIYTINRFTLLLDWAIYYCVLSIKVWLQKKIYQNEENLSKMSEFLVELKLIKFGTPGHFQNLLVDSFLSSETWDLCLWLKEVPVCSSFSTFSVTTFSASHNRC